MEEDLRLTDPGFQKLLSLDKAFKSDDIAQRFEAVLKFKTFFEKYPSPHLVTSGTEEWELIFTLRQTTMLISKALKLVFHCRLP